MHNVLEYHPENYYRYYQDHAFIYEVLDTIITVGKLKLWRGHFYFDKPGYEIRAITTKAVSLRAIRLDTVKHKQLPFNGVITGDVVANNLLVSWDIQGKFKPNEPIPYTWTSIYDLHYVGPIVQEDLFI